MGKRFMLQIGSCEYKNYQLYDNRRRLSNLAVNSGNTAIMDNDYTFDAVSNVLSVANNASLPASGNAGGRMSHAYTYDGLYRLVSATGTYTGADSKSASYTLAMGYDNMHRIKSKSQHLTQDNVQFNGTLNVGYDLSYTYGTEAGKKFQLASVKDVNYRTEETPGDNNIENNHVYLYDKNGNLVYVNTGRMMKDGHNEVGTRERKLIWDEENRLLAVDDNGFVSNYWYDADGERTVKTSGESDQVYVNGVFSGGSTNTAKFSLYVSPYLVANQGGRYTKHIYAGSQRIVSKVGDFASYGSDPRRIEYAGANTDGLSVNYKAKYAAQQQVIKDNYKTFEVPYNGTDNDNYADGEGFCCNDGSMEAAMARTKAQARAVAKSFKDPDNYENLQFFYHPDHLGSSSFITNLEGEVVQHIEYAPFGEVFIEERNSVWNTPYLFNAKEFDEETGLYYYGARYYEPRLSLWMSTDRFKENYPNMSSYSYCSNNPIKNIDVNGDTIKVITGNEKFLFSLNDHKKNTTTLTAKELYDRGIQWFAPTADNYMELIYMNKYISVMDELKHFTWDEVVKFGEVDRSMIAYRTKGPGDWKANGKPGDGYLMVTMNGYPYWTDAIGQVPFTLNQYRNSLKFFGSHELAAKETLRIGMKFGDGFILSGLFGKSDTSNSYDNEMIKRAINWASNRYKIIGTDKWNRNSIISKTNHSPSILSKPLK